VSRTSARSSATPVAGPVASHDATLIPTGPATQAFLDRARTVAEAVRAAGIPKPPTGIFLRSSRTPGLAFDTSEQKLAWTAGQVTIAPSIRLSPGGTARIAFANGESLPVTVLDARPALAGVIGTTRSNFRGIPASSCRLTITAASSTTAKVDTSSGPAAVPAWTFTARGLSRPIVVIAVPEDVLKTPLEPVPPAGLPDPDGALLEVGSLTRVEDNTLTFNLSHGTCEPDLQAHVLELEDLVVIGGTHAPIPAGTPCSDVGHSTPAVVHLTAPLGTRAVISASTGIRLIPLY
jgi:hypothetical protein